MNKYDFPDYYATPDGNIYKQDGTKVKYFKSNKYDQCLLFDKNHKRHIFGVHNAVSMYLDDNWFDGCDVHHKNENTHDNRIENLEPLSRSDHTRLHFPEKHFEKLEYHAWNKGMKMSDEFRQKCSISKKKCYAEHKIKFKGNQYLYINDKGERIIKPVYFK